MCRWSYVRVLLQFAGVLLYLPLWHRAQHSIDLDPIFHAFPLGVFFGNPRQNKDQPAPRGHWCDRPDSTVARSWSCLLFCFGALAKLGVVHCLSLKCSCFGQVLPSKSALILTFFSGLQWTWPCSFLFGQWKDTRTPFPKSGLLLHLMLSIHTWTLHFGIHHDSLLDYFGGWYLVCKKSLVRRANVAQHTVIG